MHGISAASLGNWRNGARKTIILMGDAPPHDPEPFTGYTLADVAQAAENADPVIIFPIIIGRDSEARAYFSELAERTWGTLFTAANASQVVTAIVAAIEVIRQSPIAEAGGPYEGVIGMPISFNASASFAPNGRIVQYEWDWDGDGTYDLTTTNDICVYAWLNEFSGTVRLRVTDDTGLTGIDTALVHVSLLTNRPPVANCKNVQVITDPWQCSAMVLPAQVDNGSYDPDGDPIMLSLTPGGPFQLGATAVTLTVTDSQGASNQCTATITVVDNQPPAITCPMNIVQANDAGQCSATVGYLVTASENCSLAHLACEPASGSVFPKGTTTVVCTATDGAGNAASCSFTVTVEDREAPRVACRPAPNPSAKKIPVAGKNPDSGQNPDGYYQLLAEDNCDAAPKIYVKDDASFFIAGPFSNGDIVKIIQAGNASSKPGTPPIVAQIHLLGDALVYAVDVDGNVSPSVYCKVPPPPK
jgi:hypothetical protein